MKTNEVKRFDEGWYDSDYKFIVVLDHPKYPETHYYKTFEEAVECGQLLFNENKDEEGKNHAVITISQIANFAKLRTTF